MKRLVVLIAVLLAITAPALAEKRDLKIAGKAPAEYVASQPGKAWAVVVVSKEIR